ncbi:MAG TPA: hypothetical protein VKB78_10330, partial [Pirellulales bacterium]|nr:hypothetical protein [Pirellulales bacterium]
TSPRTRKAEPYTAGGKPQNHRRISDLVPRSYVAIGFFFLAGLTAIAGLAAAHLYLPELAAWGTKEGTAAFELGSRGSLASCLGSVWLALAGLGSLLVYSIRRHKVDDYRGHYRWWFIAGLAWLVMSLDAITGLHELFRAAMTRLSGYSAPAAGHAWWIGAWGLLLAATFVRLLLDMRACRMALLTIALAPAAWCGGLAVQLSGKSLTNISPTLVAETLKLSGHFLLLLGVVLYARHVILHAQGLLPSRDAKRRKERAKKEAAEPASKSPVAGSGTRIDPPHNPVGVGNKHAHPTTGGTTMTPHSQVSSQQSGSYREDDDSDYDDDDDDIGGRNRKLSKAERKRLRKQKAEERGW